MRKVHTWFVAGYLILSFIISMFILDGEVSFGHGIGNLFYLFLIIAFNTVLLVFAYYQKGKKTEKTWLIEIAGLIFLVLIVLQATVYKGPE
jgi:hypothetical protein